MSLLLWQMRLLWMLLLRLTASRLSLVLVLRGVRQALGRHGAEHVGRDTGEDGAGAVSELDREDGAAVEVADRSDRGELPAGGAVGVNSTRARKVNSTRAVLRVL